MAQSAFAKHKHDVALHYCNQLLASTPNHADAIAMKAKLTLYLGDIQTSQQLFTRAVTLNPKEVTNYLYLSRFAADASNAEQAMSFLQRAREIEPKNLEIHAAVSTLFTKFNNAHMAVAYLEKIIEEVGIDHQIFQLYCMALLMDAKTAKAREIFEKYRKKYPPSGTFLTMFELHLPRLLENNDQVDELRQHFSEQLTRFTKEKPKIELNQYTLTPSFNLAFHNRDNKELMSHYCQMLRACAPALSHVAPHCKNGEKPAKDKTKISIGFASANMHDHPVGRCYRNLLPALQQQDDFDVKFFLLGNVQDEKLLEIQQGGVPIIPTHPDFIATRNIIASHQLDILIYPDIGMESTSYNLALARLAPYQACLTGHPDTTGIDTLDYFISAGAYEAENGQDNYTETLLRAKGIDTAFTKFSPPETWLTRADFELAEDKKLYLVPMAIQKMHPDFDNVLYQITQKDPNALIILFDDFNMVNATKKMQNRLIAKCGTEQLLFMSWQPLDKLLSLMKLADAVLSSIYFGAGSTSQIAFSFGIPMVSWPDWHARSRMVDGYYRAMGVENPPSATSADDYVDVAIKVANDMEYRENISQQILAKNDALFEDNGYKEGFAELIRAIISQDLGDYQ